MRDMVVELADQCPHCIEANGSISDQKPEIRVFTWSLAQLFLIAFAWSCIQSIETILYIRYPSDISYRV